MQVTEITPNSPRAETILRLAAYCRVSSDSKDQLHSFAAQIRYYTDYARTHPEYMLVDIYADEGLTGTSMEKRDDLNRLLQDCKKGTIDRIIVKSVSRFARNTQELLITLRMLKEIGVSVYFEEQGIDTDKLNMEMIVTFPGMAAQKESENLSGNMRWSYRRRMESGNFNGCAPAYGFDMVDGTLVVKESEAQVVRRIYDLYLQGYGKQAIADILNQEGIPRRRAQKKWCFATIHYILSNERYIGDALLQKKMTTDTIPYRKIRNKGEKAQYYVENANPPIVSREVYQAAQDSLKNRRTNSGREKKDFLLSRILRCPECGRAFRRQIASGKTYWMCSGRASGEMACMLRRLREEMVLDTFTTMMYKLKDNREMLFGSLIRQIEKMQLRSGEDHRTIHKIDKEIADLGAKNHILARLHASGSLRPAEYAAQSSNINNQITALRIERRKKLSEDSNEALLNDLRALRDILEKYEPSEEFDGEFFEQLVDSITVLDNTRLVFRLLGNVTLTERITERGRCKTA